MTHRGYIIALLAVLALCIGNLWLGFANENRQSVEQARLAAEAHHTRKVQIKGGPPAVCLREALEGAAILLEKVPSVYNPLHAYIQLQKHRYPGVTCPSK